MSLKDMVVNEIVKGVKTNEPLYKFTYIMPDIGFDDEDRDRLTHISCSNIKSVIYNYSTYVENSLEGSADYIERNWDEITDKNRHHHDISRFNIFIDRCDEIHLMLYKISLELIN